MKATRYLFLTVLLPFGACADDEPQQVDDPAIYCHYVNPFSGAAECKWYVGEWTSEQAEQDCQTPLLGMGDPGTVREVPCSNEGAVGTCDSQVDVDRSQKMWFYGGPSDVLQNSCTTLLDGTYEDFSGIEPETRGPAPAAIAAMSSDALVTITPPCAEGECLETLIAEDGWLAFTPTDFSSGTAFVFWPGGSVDPRAYAVVARAIAESGILVLVPVLPTETTPQLARMQAEYSDVATWHVGGHSHGGSVAVKVVATDATGIDGLVMWASFAGSELDASLAEIETLLLWGTNDGRLSAQSAAAMKQFLPPGTVCIEIVGGNHAQFADYLPGETDTVIEATITREEQQSQAIAQTLSVIANN